MKNKYKIILIICVIIGICSILVGSIAYYRIVVEGSIKGSTGNAVFVLKDENSNVWNNKEINLGKVNPGDSGSFTVTMDASGSTVDMYATLEFDRGTLPTNLKFYTTSDHKSELHKYYSFLETTNQTETLTIYWYWNPYISDEEDNKFINVESIEANIRVSAVQISEYAMMKNGYISDDSLILFWKDTYRPYIRAIAFSNDLSNLPSSCTEENLCWDISYNSSQKKKVYGYLIDSGLTVSEMDSSTSTTTEKALYNLYVVSEAPIFAPFSCNRMFGKFKNLVQINFNNNFNTSKVTNMFNMFSNCTSLTNLDLSSFNTSNVTDMNNMFSNCTSLTNLDLSNFNTSKVANMYQMFSSCSSLTSLDLSSFNTSNATNMDSMFSSCSSLTSLDLSSFNTSSVTNMSYMFERCSSLTSLDLSGFNTSKVTNMSYTFYSCSSLTSLDVSGFNTSNVIDMIYMFFGCSSLISLDLSNFNTSTVTNMERMFHGCSSLRSLDVSGFNTSKVTNTSWMFHGCSSLISLDLSSFNTSNVTNMGGMFYNCSSLTSLDLSNFNTSNVTNMFRMFSFCYKLQTQINITNVNTSTYIEMFKSAASDPLAHIIIGYTTNTQSIAEAMRNTCTDATAKARIELKKID